MEVVKGLGARKYIDTAEILIPQGEEAMVIIKLTGEETGGVPADLKIKINFDDSGDEAGVRFDPDGEWSKMTLSKWGNPLGVCLSTPYTIAQIEKRFVIEMMMSNYRIGTTNSLTMQFWSRDI